MHCLLNVKYNYGRIIIKLKLFDEINLILRNVG
jgi:hypothetical protein